MERTCNYFTKDKAIKYYLYDGDIWLKFPKLTAIIDESDFMPFEELRFEMITNSSLIDVVMNQNQASEEEDNIDDDDL